MEENSENRITENTKLLQKYLEDLCREKRTVAKLIFKD